MSKCKYCDKTHRNDNTGCNNLGNRNSGNFNSGDCNSGNCNSGYCNSGNFNSGDCNSGNCNSGDCNSGYCNSGNCNSGNFNSGYCNSGYCNSGDCNSGWFNTNEPKMRFFNDESDATYSEFIKGKIVYPDLKFCTWVEFSSLEKKEQTEEAQQMGGKLKTLDYKEAWLEYWGRASEEDKKWFQELPNFSWKIFTEITGIEPDNKVNDKITDEDIIEINGVKYKRIDNKYAK